MLYTNCGGKNIYFISDTYTTSKAYSCFYKDEKNVYNIKQKVNTRKLRTIKANNNPIAICAALETTQQNSISKESVIAFHLQKSAVAFL